MAILAALIGCAPQQQKDTKVQQHNGTVTAERTRFGTLADGTPIDAVTLSNSHDVSARIIAYGATLQSLSAPDRDGRVADIELGYDDLAGYVDHPNYWGATIGRYANRIDGGTFKLDGRTYHLPLNDHGLTSLHGGGKGFDVQNWRLASIQSGPTATAVFTLASPDGDAGYPGAVEAKVTYSLDGTGSLKIEFEATTTKPTMLNMTNHAIFNMAGEGSPGGATNEILTIPAGHYTPVDAHLIPTGELRDVTGTVFDFDQAVEAHRYMETQPANGRIVIAVPDAIARAKDAAA